MANKSKIQWTDRTWNPLRGCSMAKGSEKGGCLNCYAARMAARNLAALNSPTTGEQFARILPWGPRWTGKVELIETSLAEPLKWRKPQRVFVSSISDLFHESVPDEWIDRIFAVMALCPDITFQVLTKRVDRCRQYFWRVGTARAIMHAAHELLINPAHRLQWKPGFASISSVKIDIPLSNVWLGVSVENQPTAELRILTLLQTPAANRFVSYEPALGPIDFTRITVPAAVGPSFLDWVIVGGESGPDARPFDIQWARNTIQQCKRARVACFVKQLGSLPVVDDDETLDAWPAHVARDVHRKHGYVGAAVKLKDSKGGDWHEWPEDLRVREFPRQ